MSHDLSTQELHYVDWDAIKLRYEIMGETVLRLSLLFRVPAQDIETVIQLESWKVLSECSPKELEEYTTNLYGSSKTKLHLMGIYRELSLVGEFNQLEDIILTKLRQVASNVDPYSSTASRQLQNVVATYDKIAQRHSRIGATLVDIAATQEGDTVKLIVEMSDAE